MPDLGATEQIVADKLRNDLETAMRETRDMHDFLKLLYNEDLEELVVDPMIKPILETLVLFIEGVGRSTNEANMAAQLIGLIFVMRSETRDSG